MKKLLIALLAAVLASGAFAQDTAFPDIPANHWAADAVARITDLGIIIGFPDGTFRGNEAFTRYQTALVISRTLNVINDNVEAMGAMSAADIAALNAALEQLASDLAAQGVRLAATESDVVSLGDDVIADGARIDDLEAAINGVMMNMVDPMVVQEMQDQIASLGVAAATASAASAAADSGLQDQINALEVAIDAADAAASAAASAAAAAASQSAAADAELRRAVAALSAAADAAAAESAAADSGLQDQINALSAAAADAAAASAAADAALSDAVDAAAAAAAAALADAAAASDAGDAALSAALDALSAAAADAAAASAAADAALSDAVDAAAAAAAAALADAAAASDAGDAELRRAIAALSAASDDADAALGAALDAGAAEVEAAFEELEVGLEAAFAEVEAGFEGLGAGLEAAAAEAAAALAAAAAASDAGDAELRRAIAALSAASDDADAGLQDQIDALSAAAAAAAAASDAGDAALSAALDALSAAADDAAAASAAADAGLQGQIDVLRVSVEAASARADAASARADAVAADAAAARAALQGQIDALGAAATAAAAASDAADAALSDAIDAASAAAAAADTAAAAESAAADAGLQDQIDALGAAATAAAAASDAADAALSDAIDAASAAAAAADTAAAAESAAADAGLQGQIDALGAAATAAAAASDAADAALSDAIDAASAAAAASDAAAAAESAAADAGLQGQIDALGAAATAAAAASDAADAALSDAIDAASAAAAASDAAAAAESAAADAALSDALDALSAAAAAAAAESAAADAALSDALDAAATAAAAADAALSDAIDAAAAAAAAADAAIRDELAAAAAELHDQIHELSHEVEDAAAAAAAADAALSDALAAAAAESADADAGLGDSIAAAAAAAEVARAKLGDALDAAAAAAAAAAANNAAGVADNAGDIANIREFVILLRRNQVAIRDRVAALEAADTEQDTAIEGLDDRIGALESNLFDLSGSIKVSYKMVHASGGDAEFDIDRAFGSGFDRSGYSAISTGEFDDSDPKDGKVDRKRHQDADIRGDEEKGVDVTLNVNLDFGNALGGYAKLSLAKIPVLEKAKKDTSGHVNTDASDPEGGTSYNVVTGEYYAIKVDRVYTAAKIGGMTDLEIVFGEKAGLSHGAYGSSFTGSSGINFRLVPGMVAFSPEISGFYVPKVVNKDKETVAAAVQGLELRLSPMEGVSVGGHVSRWADGDTTTRDTVNALVVGFDAEVSLQIFDVAVEWNSASFSDDPSRNEDAFYVTLTVDDMMGDMMMSIPLLDSLKASYFDIADGWAALAMANDKSFPFKEDQAGLVANVGLDLVLVDLDGYVTSYRANSTQDAVLALGADATAPLFSGLSLEGYFHTASVTPQGGTAVTVDDVKSRMNANEVAVGAESLERDKNYNTGFGITLKHDGMSADALVSGLNLELGYSQTEADFSKRTIKAGADMALPLDIITVSPYGSIEWATDADANPDNTTTIKVGASVTTQQIDTFLAPSLEGNVNYRNTGHANATAATYTASELQFSVGLSLNEFLFDESVLKASYASYSGTNVKPNRLTADADDNAHATYAVGKDDNNGLTTATNGFEIVWTYHGLELIYGSFAVDPDTNSTGDQSSANYFTIAYSVSF